MNIQANAHLTPKLPTSPRLDYPMCAQRVPQSLVVFENSTTVSKKISRSIRDTVFGRYIVRYSIHVSTIIILRVWHELEGER